MTQIETPCVHLFFQLASRQSPLGSQIYPVPRPHMRKFHSSTTGVEARVTSKFRHVNMPSIARTPISDQDAKRTVIFRAATLSNSTPMS